MMDDRVFRALGNADRRLILDLLHKCDGRSATDLQRHLTMSRFGVRKHLTILGDARLVAARRRGRRTVYYLTPEPIDGVRRRWINKYLTMP
jgi:DNA-binding transcriptional ArsR family regulator